MNIVIKKDGFDVYLFYVLIYNRDKRENRFVIHKLYHQRENIIIIMILLLFESLNNLMCFITSDFLREASLYDVNLTIF